MYNREFRNLQAPKFFSYLRINDLNEGDPRFSFFPSLFFFFPTRFLQLKTLPSIFPAYPVVYAALRGSSAGWNSLREGGGRGPATSRISTRRRRRDSTVVVPGTFFNSVTDEKRERNTWSALTFGPELGRDQRLREERRRWKIRMVARKSLKLCETEIETDHHSERRSTIFYYLFNEIGDFSIHSIVSILVSLDGV